MAVAGQKDGISKPRRLDYVLYNYPNLVQWIQNQGLLVLLERGLQILHPCRDDGGDVGCSSRVSPCLGDAGIGYWLLRPWRPWWQWREWEWCPQSRGVLFLPGLLEDTPTHVHANC
jgi:hypothetical protein